MMQQSEYQGSIIKINGLQISCSCLHLRYVSNFAVINSSLIQMLDFANAEAILEEAMAYLQSEPSET
jgi:hypothetical protein